MCGTLHDDIVGNLHLAIVLGQFFIRMHQSLALPPMLNTPLYMAGQYGIGIGQLLVAVDVHDILLQLLLEGMHGAANVCHSALGLKLRIAVTGDLTPSEECPEPVVGTANTVIQDGVW